MYLEWAIARLEGALLAHLLDLDHERREAFLVLDAAGEILGVGRLADGEFALTVRSDMKGHGIGRLLLDRVVRYALEHGLDHVDGTVLAENGAMIELARHAGFAVARNAGDTLALRLCLP